jgi:phage gp36-like protein
MSYATRDDFIARYGEDELRQITDMATPPGDTIDDAVIAARLDDADAEINSYLAARVDTPVAPVPHRVKQVACVIARYLLWRDHASERVRQDYADAIAWLKDVAAGKAAIGDTGATEAPSGGAPQVSAPERVFTRDTLKGF